MRAASSIGPEPCSGTLPSATSGLTKTNSRRWRPAASSPGSVDPSVRVISGIDAPAANPDYAGQFAFNAKGDTFISPTADAWKLSIPGAIATDGFSALRYNPTTDVVEWRHGIYREEYSRAAASYNVGDIVHDGTDYWISRTNNNTMTPSHPNRQQWAHLTTNMHYLGVPTALQVFAPGHVIEDGGFYWLRTGSAVTQTRPSSTTTGWLRLGATSSLPANSVLTTVTSFGNLLGSGDATVQAALDTLDDAGTATNIRTTVTDFNGVLGAGDTNVQLALDELDDAVAANTIPPEDQDALGLEYRVNDAATGNITPDDTPRRWYGTIFRANSDIELRRMRFTMDYSNYSGGNSNRGIAMQAARVTRVSDTSYTVDGGTRQFMLLRTFPDGVFGPSTEVRRTLSISGNSNSVTSLEAKPRTGATFSLQAGDYFTLMVDSGEGLTNLSNDSARDHIRWATGVDETSGYGQTDYRHVTINHIARSSIERLTDQIDGEVFQDESRGGAHDWDIDYLVHAAGLASVLDNGIQRYHGPVVMDFRTGFRVEADTANGGADIFLQPMELPARTAAQIADDYNFILGDAEPDGGDGVYRVPLPIIGSRLADGSTITADATTGRLSANLGSGNPFDGVLSRNLDAGDSFLFHDTTGADATNGLGRIDFVIMGVEIRTDIKDEGGAINNNADSIDFTGAGITCTNDLGENEVTCDVPAGTGGGGGSTTANQIYYAHMGDIQTTVDDDSQLNNGPHSHSSTTWFDYTSGLVETINVGGFTVETTGTGDAARDKVVVPAGAAGTYEITGFLHANVRFQFSGSHRAWLDARIALDRGGTISTIGIGQPSYARNQYGIAATELGSEALSVHVLEVGDKLWVEGLTRLSANTTDWINIDGANSVLSLVRADVAGPAGPAGADGAAGQPGEIAGLVEGLDGDGTADYVLATPTLTADALLLWDANAPTVLARTSPAGLLGTMLQANPGGTGNTALTSMRIGSTAYDLPTGGGGGTTVTANPGIPSGTPTYLDTITIGTDANLVVRGAPASADTAMTVAQIPVDEFSRFFVDLRVGPVDLTPEYRYLDFNGFRESFVTHQGEWDGDRNYQQGNIVLTDASTDPRWWIASVAIDDTNNQPTRNTPGLWYHLGHRGEYLGVLTDSAYDFFEGATFIYDSVFYLVETESLNTGALTMSQSSNVLALSGGGSYASS